MFARCCVSSHQITILCLHYIVSAGSRSRKESTRRFQALKIKESILLALESFPNQHQKWFSVFQLMKLPVDISLYFEFDWPELNQSYQLIIEIIVSWIVLYVQWRTCSNQITALFVFCADWGGTWGDDSRWSGHGWCHDPGYLGPGNIRFSLYKWLKQTECSTFYSDLYSKNPVRNLNLFKQLLIIEITFKSFSSSMHACKSDMLTWDMSPGISDCCGCVAGVCMDR